MKTAPRLGLLTGGPVSRTGVARLPAVRGRLGPVKASSFRVARRMVNAWKAGFAVRTVEELEKSPVILIDVSDGEVDSTVEELAALPWDWNRRSVLLWSASRDASSLQRLEAKGAATASFHLLPGFETTRLTAEGSSLAVRQLKRIFRGDGWRVRLLLPGKKPLFRAGLAFTNLLPLPLLESCVETIVASGLTYAEAVDVAAAQMERVVRAYVNSGKRAWPADVSISESVAGELQKQRSELANLYRTGIVHANALLGRSEIESENP